MRKLGRVSQGSLDVLGSQGRVTAQDFGLRRAFRQAIENAGYQHAGSLGTKLSRADVGVGAQEATPIGHSAMVTGCLNEKPDPDAPDRVSLLTTHAPNVQTCWVR